VATHLDYRHVAGSARKRIALKAGTPPLSELRDTSVLFKESVCHMHLRFALGSRRFESHHLHYPDTRTVRRRGVVAARGIDRLVLGNVPVQIDDPRSESSPCG